MKKIDAYNGIVVFDNEEKRFWKASEIISLAKEFWKDLDMGREPTDDDLAYVFREEFSAFCDDEGTYWDDMGKWQILEAPRYLGFGITEENDDALIRKKYELAKGMRP